jgi:transposase
MTGNRNKPHHSPHKRAKIVAQYLSGVSAKAIAAKFDLSAQAVYNINQRYKNQQSAKSNPRSGRPPLLDERHKRHIFRVIEADPFITTTEIIRQANLPCATRTLTAFLRRQCIKHFKALRRPLLTPEIAKKRLEFANQHVNKPLSWWRRVIFSDEAIIERGSGGRVRWAWAANVC